MNTVMITGATSGFGEATARLFATKGWKIIITGRRQKRLDKLQQELGGIDKVHCCCFDITDRKAVEKAFQSLPSQFSDIDVLVNNAGLALGLEPADQTNLDDWEQMVDTNIKGLMYCTRTILPKMKQQGQGYIINIGSVAGNWPYPGGNVYCATKAFVRQFSLVRFKDDAQRADGVYQQTAALSAEDIANTIFWLANTPLHVNVTTMEIMPTEQATGPLAIYRA